jgi:hypothetical protein
VSSRRELGAKDGGGGGPVDDNAPPGTVGGVCELRHENTAHPKLIPHKLNSQVAVSAAMYGLILALPSYVLLPISLSETYHFVPCATRVK